MLVRLAGVIAPLFCASSAAASSVVPMTVETLADHAGQVVVGRIAAIRSYWAEDPRRIESEVTLEQVEYLKGGLPANRSTLTFTVPGGAIDGFEMRLGCAPAFAIGEKWLLFLLPTYKTFPVVGISSGALRVVADHQGVERLSDSHGAAVRGLDERGFITFAQTAAPLPVAHLHDATDARVSFDAARAEPVEAMRLAEFVNLIGPILAQSTDHRLSVPAGRREASAPRAVPLRLAGDVDAHPSIESGAIRGAAAVHRTESAPRRDRHVPTEAGP
jgi:hypothetical protein